MIVELDVCVLGPRANAHSPIGKKDEPMVGRALQSTQVGDRLARKPFHAYLRFRQQGRRSYECALDAQRQVRVERCDGQRKRKVLVQFLKTLIARKLPDDLKSGWLLLELSEPVGNAS